MVENSGADDKWPISSNIADTGVDTGSPLANGAPTLRGVAVDESKAVCPQLRRTEKRY